MDAIADTRYAVVSCHVERVLDDRVWAHLASWLQVRPGGFAVLALLRPADAAAGENEDAWLARAREAGALGPVGLHTHWTGPTHARPSPGGEPPGERVLREGRRLQELGLPVSAFCGGGWYTDADVAAAVADLGLVDCTARAVRPSYLPTDARWAELDGPATVGVGSRELRCVPTTHTIGGAVRAVLSPAGLRREVVHVYFHDTDLLDWRRRNALRAALMLLGRRRRPALLDEVAAAAGEGRSLGWEDIARGTGGLR